MNATEAIRSLLRAAVQRRQRADRELNLASAGKYRTKGYWTTVTEWELAKKEEASLWELAGQLAGV